MILNANYIAVTRIEDEKKEGFQTVDVQDNFLCKGRVDTIPEAPVYISNRVLAPGDIVIFAKYSPDTHDIEEGGVKMKFVSVRDILAVI